jgi:malate permease and related proteins
MMTARILSITLPIFFIILIGLIYGRFKKPNMVGANKIILDIALPCLIFTSLSTKHFDLASSFHFLFAAALIVLLSGLAILPFTRFVNASKRSMLPTVMFANMGPIGIPLTVLAFGPEGLGPAVLLLVTTNILHFTFGVGIVSGRIDAKLIYANPLIWSTILGIGFSYLNLQLPEWFDVSLAMIGNILVPLMLISLGTRLAESRIEHAKAGLITSLLAVVIRLAIAYAVLNFFTLDLVQRGALILFAGLPPGIFNYMIAERFNQEPDKVASIVIIGHIISIVFLPLGIWLALK